MTVYKYEFDKSMLVCANKRSLNETNNKRSLPTILKNYEFGFFFKKQYFDLFFF